MRGYRERGHPTGPATQGPGMGTGSSPGGREPAPHPRTDGQGPGQSTDPEAAPSGQEERVTEGRWASCPSWIHMWPPLTLLPEGGTDGNSRVRPQRLGHARVRSPRGAWRLETGPCPPRPAHERCAGVHCQPQGRPSLLPCCLVPSVFLANKHQHVRKLS